MSKRVVYPFGGWRPREYQRPVWDALNRGCRHAELIWHRRAGKDEIAMNYAACEMIEKPGTYWHLLPKANQVKKAIWESVDFHTGRRRLDQVFPPEIFDRRENDMFVRCKLNGSTWQAFGSDNYEGAIGSGPRGIVYSEWAQANPSARAYFRPMITETQGWELYLTTPRGKNHAHQTFQAAQQDPDSYAELLTVYDTGVLTADQLAAELREYVSTYGEAMGMMYYEQEYECSFDAAILGAVFATEFRLIDQEARIRDVPHDPQYPVHVAMDIGRSDRTTIWWFQVIAGDVRVIDHYWSNGKDPDHYASVILGYDVQINLIDKQIEVIRGAQNDWAHHMAYNYGSINLPHDGRTKTFATNKSAEEQFSAVFGAGRVRITPNLSVNDGIMATRQMLKRRCYFDTSCEFGVNACRQYHYEWDDDKKMFRDRPEHDWTSDHADGLRYVGVLVAEDKLPMSADEPLKGPSERTFNDLVEVVRRRRAEA